MTNGNAQAGPGRIGLILNALAFSTIGALLLAFMISPASAQETSFEDGYAAYERGDFYGARTIWEQLGEMGDARALFNLGTLYSEGRGTDRDPLTAELYWSLAADAGHVRAMHNLALSFIARASGLTEEQAALEYEAAVTWLQEAADDGFANSQYSLGKMYQYGLAVDRNDELAAQLFVAAANQGFVNAQYNLGKAYRDGRGVDEDITQSTHYFRMAAEQGHVGAQNRLATRFARGQGVERDDVEALFWASLAADQDNATAIENRNALLARMSNDQVDEAAARLLAFTQSN